jgi:hypothetical protein
MPHCRFNADASTRLAQYESRSCCGVVPQSGGRQRKKPSPNRERSSLASV